MSHLHQSKAGLLHGPTPKQSEARPCSRASSNPHHPFQDGYLPSPFLVHSGQVPEAEFQPRCEGFCSVHL